MSLLTISSKFFIILLFLIIQTTSALYLDCDTRNYTRACMTSSLVVLDRNEKIATNHSNILELIIVNATVNFLPSNLPEIFPNLMRLEVVNSSLLEINFNDLLYPKLSALVLSHNKITKIDEIFLNANLKVLRLDHNEISEVNPRAFDDLENLQELKLDGNICIIEDEPNVKILIKEVKRNCAKILKSKMTFLMDLEKVEATSMAIIVVIILCLIAILVAIFLRLRMEQYEYEVKEPRNEMEDFTVTSDMPNEQKMYPSLSLHFLNEKH